MLVETDEDTETATALPLVPPPPPIAVPLSTNPARASGGRSADEDEKTPVPPKADAKPGVDIDWDDEDEATMVFDKSVEDTARSLLHSAPPPPPPAAGAPPAPPPAAGAPPPSRQATLLSRPPMPSAPPPTLPRAPLPPPKAVPLPYTAPIPPQQAVFEPPAAQPSSSGRGVMIGAVVLLLAGAGAAAMFLMPKKGSMVLTVAGPGNKSIDTVEVYVDGAKKCEASPCRVVDLAAGTHLVKVTAAGYQPTADQAVKISNGDEAVQNIALTRASEGTGIRVAVEGRGVKLSVDGKEIGPLPQELKELAPGDHVVHLDGGERYDSFEKHVTVEADKMETVDPKLRVKKGLATIKLGDNAEDAKVLLVSGSRTPPDPAVADHRGYLGREAVQHRRHEEGLHRFRAASRLRRRPGRANLLGQPDSSRQRAPRQCRRAAAPRPVGGPAPAPAPGPAPAPAPAAALPGRRPATARST